MPPQLGSTGAGAAQAVNFTMVVTGPGAANVGESARSAIRAAMSRLVPGLGAHAPCTLLRAVTFGECHCLETAVSLLTMPLVGLLKLGKGMCFNERQAPHQAPSKCVPREQR